MKRSPFFNIATTRPRASGWSLAEMLAVIGVLAVLAAAALPSLRGMMQASSRSTALGVVIAVFEQARSLALATGRSTYVVVADAGVSEERAFRAMAIYREPENLDDLPEPVTPWACLPPGCRFVTKAGSASLFSALAEGPLPARFRLPGEATPRALPYLKFDATGGVAHPAQSNEAALLLSSRADGAGPWDRISVALFTGRPKCEPAP